MTPMLFLLIVMPAMNGPVQYVEVRTEALCLKAQAILHEAKPPMYSICVANDKNGKN
jgi:hypothetical protein